MPSAKDARKITYGVRSKRLVAQPTLNFGSIRSVNPEFWVRQSVACFTDR
jgi:hypothetical protein